MMEFALFLTSISLICLSAVRFSVAYLRNEPDCIKWIIPIPVMGIAYLCILLVFYWIH